MPENFSTADVSPQVTAEREHLERSRAALGAMRAETLALRAQGGNAVSTEVLNQAIAARAAALADRADVPLFFGRLDYDPELGSAFSGERFYVGRRHVHDAHGDPMVVDWRAPVSLAFYRASAKEPMGLGLRRRFGFAAGQLTAIEDEPLGRGDAPGPGESRILRQEIERPRTGPMRDIVATIQPEQDEIVRADLGTSICVQGAPGTGKTAVGLHRVAFLLYAHRDRIRRGGALVVGPNRQFLKYIEQVLPALGEIDVAQATVAELVERAPVRAVEDAAVARLKGDARMAKVLRAAVWAHVAAPAEPLVVIRGSRHWRVPAYEIAEHVETLRAREVRYSAGRAMLGQRIAHSVLRRMEAAGESPDDRVQDAVARSRPVKQAVDLVWPAVDPAKLLHALLSGPELLARAARAAADGSDADGSGTAGSENVDAGILTPAEQQSLLWAKPPRSAGAAKWTAADVVLLDELADLLERTASLAHVVVDEAQDLSAMQLRAVARRCTTGSVTVLGDIAQATTPWATGSWQVALEHLGKSDAVIEELTQGFRVPRQVIEYAARLLPRIAPRLAPPTSVRQQGGGLEVVGVQDAAELEPWLLLTVRNALSEEGSIGLITADAALDGVAAALERDGVAFSRLDREGADENQDTANVAVDGADAADGAGADSPAAAARLVLVPASLAKGLEYDQVIVLEPSAIAEAEHDELLGLRRLYVVLTRAVTRLTVLHARPLPPELA